MLHSKALSRALQAEQLRMVQLRMVQCRVDAYVGCSSASNQSGASSETLLSCQMRPERGGCHEGYARHVHGYLTDRGDGCHIHQHHTKGIAGLRWNRVCERLRGLSRCGVLHDSGWGKIGSGRQEHVLPNLQDRGSMHRLYVQHCAGDRIRSVRAPSRPTSMSISRMVSAARRAEWKVSWWRTSTGRAS